MRASNMRLSLMWTSGLYYLITGVWPLVSIETFQRVTGPKTDHLATGRESDHWLVFTVGVLVAAIAITMLFAAWRRSQAGEIVVLALATALGLAGIDILFVARGVIAPIYLADAIAEVALIAGWTVVIFRSRRI